MSTATDLLAPLLARLGYDVRTYSGRGMYGTACPAVDVEPLILAIAILDYERDERLTPPERDCLIRALRTAEEGRGVTYFPGFTPPSEAT